jgi:SAM-dependent methyltransferase
MLRGQRGQAESILKTLTGRMDAAEYANLDRVEGGHWYYAGKREFARRWLLRVRPPSKQDTLLDCGAGTGRFALEMQAHCRVLVLDDHEEALRLLRGRFRPEQILSLSGDQVPLPDRSLDYVTALDVLEHVPDDASVVRGFHRLLKPGGIALVTVPASMALWSDWDVALHHFRRYNRAQLCAIFPSDQWEIVHSNYTNVVAYPAVWWLRRWRGWFPASGAPRAEDRVPGRFTNRVLKQLFVGMALARFPFPFGVSLVLVARKRGG